MAQPTTEFLVDSPPRLEVHYDVVATPTVVHTTPHSSITGCLYSQQGQLLRLAQRMGGHHGDYFPSSDQERLAGINPEKLPALKGKSLYLGHHMPHYGHFLVEMLPALWSLASSCDYDHFVFHPFVFGRNFPSYIQEALGAFGIDWHEVYLIDKAVLLREVTIPERLIKLNHSANLRCREVYRQLGDRLPTPDLPTGGRYYLSRVQNSLRNAGRTVINEPSLETALRRLGFAVVYPEQLALPEQVAIMKSAQVVCGLSGSALHNCLFMRPGTLLIELGDLRSGLASHPMQSLCNAVSMVHASFVPFQGRVLEDRHLTSRIDVASTAQAVVETLRNQALPPVVPPTEPVHPQSLLGLAQQSLRLSLKTRLRMLKWRYFSGGFRRPAP